MKIHILTGCLLIAPAFAQGPLTPPGAPAPMMKTLDQIEPRALIVSAPFTITAPGSYFLGSNLTVSAGNAITIAASGVTLDLNGFTIQSTASPAGGTGILIGSGQRNLAIFNGHIQGGVTNSGGVFGGPGFQRGIFATGTAPSNVRVRDVNISGCSGDGINLGVVEESGIVEFCLVQAVGGAGIVAHTVLHSSATECGGNGIVSRRTTRSTGVAVGSGIGVLAGTAESCRGASTNGNAVVADTALNSVGFSITSRGIFATTAQNCYGVSLGSSAGLNADTALNCYGSSQQGPGLDATSVQSSYGFSSMGTGLVARVAAHSIGYRFSGTAIRATIANGCWALQGTNSVTYKYNMP